MKYLLNLEALSLRKSILFAFCLTLLSGFIPNIDLSNFTSYFGPFIVNWSHFLTASNFLQPQVWSLSQRPGIGFPFHYLIWWAYGVECEAGGCGAWILPSISGILLDIGFFLAVLLLVKKIRNWFLPFIFGISIVAIGLLVLGHVPFPNRCPNFNDRVQYSGYTSGQDLTVDIKNLTDGRTYSCKLDFFNNRGSYDCLKDPKPGDTWTINAMTGLDPGEACTDSSANFGIGNDDCGYTCSIGSKPVLNTSSCQGESCKQHCPGENDDLVYTYIDQTTGNANFVNKFDQRRYSCTLDGSNNYDDYNCKTSPQIGTIVHADGWGVAEPPIIYNHCVSGQIEGISTKNPQHHNFKQYEDDRGECSYLCKME